MNSPAAMWKKGVLRIWFVFQEGLKGLEKIRKGAMMDSVEAVKIDDPRLDESFSFLFVFRKGDIVVNRENRTLRGRINDGVYLGNSRAAQRGPLTRRVRRFTRSSFQTTYCRSSTKKRSRKLRSKKVPKLPLSFYRSFF